MVTKVSKVAADEGFQQTEEFVHLGFRTPPVLGGEGKQRQKSHARLAGRLHGFADSLHPLAVAEGARQAARIRPAPIAIHDDRNMLRDDAMLNCRHWRGSKRLREDDIQRLSLKPA